MRIGRTALIPAIVTLAVAGSVLAGAGMSAAAAGAPSVHVQHVTAPSSHPMMKYRG
jgi:hypothetical protein